MGVLGLEDAVRRVASAFAGYNAEFRAVTRRAQARFEARDRFAQRSAGLPDAAFARTFFSSVSRRLFGTVGVDPDIEFAAVDLDPLEGAGGNPETRRYDNRGDLALLIEDLLDDLPLRCPWIDFDRSVHHIAQEVAQHLRAAGLDADAEVRSLEILRPVFFQSTRAYVVGRLDVAGGYAWPLLIALQHTERGLLVDAVMLDEDDVSVVFGFTRSYFHADLERVAETVVFLRRLLPRKPLSELFTVLGRARQGKTERYRELVRHLTASDDLFAHAPGERGLVMICFTLPSLDVVFKLIRDRFPPVKNILRQDVLDKYQFVFRHDRAGRLVDAQEFKRVRLPRTRFAPALRTVLDYGQAIRDLALSNVFAGDLLLKNFGVTRHGRVIFYDYDELCRVTDCRFRDVPQASNDEDEMRGETWFYVADNDVFPETFLNFLAFTDAQREAFVRTHGDLLTADFWRGLQQRHRAGELLEVLPYQPRRIGVASSAGDPG